MKKKNKKYRPLLVLIEMQEKRILKSVESSKVKINNYLNNEKVEVINDIETQFLKRKLISVNFEDFMKKKINTKNMMHSIIICIISIIGFLRILLGAYTTDPEISVSYTPTQVSTEAHRCYNTINSINARNQIQLQTKLKVRL